MTASNIGNVSEKNSNPKEERKLRKPLIEKKRRERINCSLEQLKGIMVDAYNLDQSKLEKADVLEITVQHMEGMQRGLVSGGSSSTINFESRQRYSSGYIQCMQEVHNLLLSCPGMDKTLGARLLNHLLKSLPHISGENAATAAGSGGNSGPNISSGSRSSSPHSPLSPAPAPAPAPATPAPLPLNEGGRIGGPGRREEPPTSSSPSTLSSLSSSSPSPQPTGGHALPHGLALPPLFPAGDPSMWRPW
ncbi:hairy-related 8a [Engraulis encrasicolus]|uniref:hairy-related 8a n=1 Tax=Engraulis encrasicolus TaxID=184585 RepID=UPI002FD72BB0